MNNEPPGSVYKAAYMHPVLKDMMRLIKGYSHDEGMTRKEYVAILRAFQDVYVNYVGEPSEELETALEEARKGY